MLIALAAIVAVLGTGIGVYQWQHGQRVSSSGAAITRLQAQLADRSRQISALNDRAITQSRRLERAQAQIASLKKSGQATAAEVQSLQAQLDTTRNELATSRRQLQAMVGPSLADGAYTGVLYAADDADSPPRVAMFVIEDARGNVLPDKGWRVLEVSQNVTVRLTTPPLGPSTKGFGAFVEAWSHGDPTFAYLHSVGYSITVSSDRVTKLVEIGGHTWGG